MASKLKSNLLLEIQAAGNHAAMTYAELDKIRLDPSQPRKLKLGYSPDNADGVPVPPDIPLSNVPALLVASGDARDDSAELVRLAVNILQDGVRTPITVTTAQGGLFKVVTGERRVTAALMARKWARELATGAEDLTSLGYTPRAGYNFDTIAAVVDSVEPNDRFRMQVAENLLRQDMSAEDMGRAWKKMLDDGLFPNVYAIARHFGMEETRIQSHIDLVDMSEEVTQLRDLGITGLEVTGRLLSSLRKARKQNEPATLYDNFLAIWKAHTTYTADGTPIHPGARSVLELARAEKSLASVETAATTAAIPAAALNTEPADSLDTGADREFEREFAAEQADNGEAFDQELAAEQAVIPARESQRDFETASVGENIPRNVAAPALDKTHKSDVLSVPAFDLSPAQARRALALLGVELQPDEVTADALIEALQTVTA
jgi:ParB-like chromosome segregation protein Spo0J